MSAVFLSGDAMITDAFLSAVAAHAAGSGHFAYRKLGLTSSTPPAAVAGDEEEWEGEDWEEEWVEEGEEEDGQGDAVSAAPKPAEPSWIDAAMSGGDSARSPSPARTPRDAKRRHVQSSVVDAPAPAAVPAPAGGYMHPPQALINPSPYAAPAYQFPQQAPAVAPAGLTPVQLQLLQSWFQAGYWAGMQAGGVQ
eukprot:TRINITY_DN27234_c0_g1_i1.p1 TRINITY_DN27234_c0_g1~~TRINITY_DN27234_c0_g1_i1.p1  ORF type:complete len:194 (+),score=43.94 TRINITY_DN27234_c0_g1_i1:70-651(+)